MNELERYLGATCIDIFQPDIIKKTPTIFPDLHMTTIITDMGANHPKMEGEMTYIWKKNIGEAIHNKLRKKDMYETSMHKI